MTTEAKSYKLNNILLVESNFERDSYIEFEKEINKDIKIDINHNEIDDNLLIELFVTINGIIEDKIVYSLRAKYAGLFSIGDINIIPVEKFAKINGPAIIFPYLREHITSLSLKGGIEVLILPPINFVTLK